MPLAHDHKFSIGDPAALKALVEKLDNHGAKQTHKRNRLLKAVKKAEDIAKSASGKNPKKKYKPEEIAFYHGLLTGYSVALML